MPACALPRALERQQQQQQRERKEKKSQCLYGPAMKTLGAIRTAATKSDSGTNRKAGDGRGDANPNGRSHFVFGQVKAE